MRLDGLDAGNILRGCIFLGLRHGKPKQLIVAIGFLDQAGTQVLKFIQHGKYTGSWNENHIGTGIGGNGRRLRLVEHNRGSAKDIPFTIVLHNQF